MKVFPASNATLGAAKIKCWLSDRAGLDPALLERAWLDRAIEERRQRLGIADETTYCGLLDRDADEREWLIQQVAVGETWLFRYPASFQQLVKHLTHRLVQRPKMPTLRMLSVACSTGDEPYSMVMAAVQAGWPSDRVRVDAVDRSEKALTAARGGRYSSRALRDDAPPWARRWLHERHGRLQVAPQIQRAVRFECADVLAGPSWLESATYPVVFCRNLLIYLHSDARNRLVERLVNWVEPEGQLFVGHAEHLRILRNHFVSLPAAGVFALQRRVTAQAAVVSAPSRLTPAAERASLPSRHAFRPKPSRGASQPPAEDLPRDAPNDGPASDELFREARELADRGELEAAAETAQRALKDAGPTTALFHLLGNVELARGRFVEAREALRRAVYLQPDHEEALLQLAIVCKQLGNNAQAIRYRHRAARVHRRNQAK